VGTFTGTNGVTVDLFHPGKREDLREAAKIASIAFFEDPNYVQIFPDDRNRHAALEFMFYRNFWLLSVRAPEQIWMVKEKENVIAVFITAKYSITRMDSVLAGVLGLLQFDRHCMTRMFEAKDDYELHEKKFNLPKNAFRLERVAVKKSHQGKGIGTAALGTVVEKLLKGETFILGTPKKINETFYQRFDFKTVAHFNGWRGVETWVMVKN
jgi:GNAT superfamily N-acetyltransferase